MKSVKRQLGLGEPNRTMREQNYRIQDSKKRNVYYINIIQLKYILIYDFFF